MGGNTATVSKHAADLKDYTDTVAAIHLLKEVLTGSAVITIPAAKAIVSQENLKKTPSIGNVVKAILDAAGKPDENQAQWKKINGVWHLEAAITISGAVYTVDLVLDEQTGKEQHYTVNITSKLSDDKKVGRGKLFFDTNNSASVKMVYQEGELKAVTKNGLAVDASSFTPYPFQNEILAKFSQSLNNETTQQRLAVMGTGSGKSIIMAGIAQAVGKTVMIVPDEALVKQQSKEVQDMLGKGIVNGKKTTPTVFTLDQLKDLVDINWTPYKKSNGEIDWSKLSVEDQNTLREAFSEVLNGTGEKKFDQIVLQAEHPLFKIIAPEIKDAMVLLDESHRHTFNEEDAKILEGLKSNNSVLALTATPTSRLYEIFPGEPLDDLNLGAVIEIGKARPIKPEVAYAKSTDLVTQAVTNYFSDYYLQSGDVGYTDPKTLKEQMIKNNIPEQEAEQKAISQALELNRRRCQRNMAFSDDKATREELTGTYQKIANGDGATINRYQANVAHLRRESEITARIGLELSLNPKADVSEIRKRLEKEIPLPKVDLDKEIQGEQQKDIQRTINSYAMALIFGERPDKVAEKDRTNKLDAQLASYDKNIQKFNVKNDEIATTLLSQLQACKSLDKKTLEANFKKVFATSAVMNLPDDQRDEMIKLIVDRAEKMATNINQSKPVSDIIKNAAPVDLDALKATQCYAGSVDMKTKPKDINTQLAQIEVGIRTHIVSDQVIATGVSIKDILSVQVINTFSPVIEADHNVINNTLSGPQAVGRCVREADGRAHVTQIVDERYKDKGLILTVDEIIDSKNSAQKTKTVIENRQRQAQKEEKEAFLVRKTIGEFFGKNMPELELIKQEKKQLHKQLETLNAMLESEKNYLDTTEAKLVQVQESLVFLPGNEREVVPPQYRNDPELVSQWYSRKDLPVVIEHTKERIAKIEKEIKAVEVNLQKKDERIEALSEEAHREVNAVRAEQGGGKPQ